MMDEQKNWRVVVRYTGQHAGMWYGPAMTRKEAEEQLIVERARVHGSAWIEQMGRRK
jgi:hypothetical protein